MKEKDIIEFYCSNSSCGKKLRGKRSLAGKKISCPVCKLNMVVPKKFVKKFKENEEKEKNVTSLKDNIWLFFKEVFGPKVFPYGCPNDSVACAGGIEVSFWGNNYFCRWCKKHYKVEKVFDGYLWTLVHQDGSTNHYKICKCPACGEMLSRYEFHGTENTSFTCWCCDGSGIKKNTPKSKQNNKKNNYMEVFIPLIWLWSFFFIIFLIIFLFGNSKFRHKPNSLAAFVPACIITGLYIVHKMKTINKVIFPSGCPTCCDKKPFAVEALNFPAVYTCGMCDDTWLITKEEAGFYWKTVNWKGTMRVCVQNCPQCKNSLCYYVLYANVDTYWCTNCGHREHTDTGY